MKAHGSVETQLHSFLALALDGLGWSVSRTGGFTRWGKSAWYPLNTHLEGARAGVDTLGGKKSLVLSEIETRLLGLPGRSLVTIPSGVP